MKTSTVSARSASATLRMPPPVPSASCLDDVLELHPERGTVAEVGLEHLCLVRGAKDDVSDAGRADAADQVGQERDARGRQHRLRGGQREGPQPGAQAAHQDHGVDVGHRKSVAQHSDSRRFQPGRPCRVCGSNGDARFSLVPMSEPNVRPDDAAQAASPDPPQVPGPPRVSYRRPGEPPRAVRVRVVARPARQRCRLGDVPGFPAEHPARRGGAGRTSPTLTARAQNILLVGNDTRAGATPAELKALHTGQDHGTANADTMMVLHIPTGGGRPTLVSFPRDSWVSDPRLRQGQDQRRVSATATTPPRPDTAASRTRRAPG